jgi:stage V sporulation protein S
MREHRYAEVQAIGASAVNQAIKAIAIARGYLEQDDMDLVVIPGFTEVQIEGNERTAVRFAVFPRPQNLIGGEIFGGKNRHEDVATNSDDSAEIAPSNHSNDGTQPR